MKVLILNDYAEKIGGMEIYCYALKDLLEKRGYQVRFFGGKGNLKEHNLIHFIFSFFSFRYYFKIKREMKDFEPDIIHAFSFFGNISASFLFAARKYRIPVIVTPPGFYPYALPRLTPGKIYRIITMLKVLLYREIVKRYVDVFTCLSKIFADFLRDKVGIENNKIKFVPLYTEWGNTTEGKGYNTKDILYVGRLSKGKGIEYLIQAIPRISKKFPETKLHIVGEGDMERNLKDLANKLGIEDKAIFHGYVPHENLAKVYKEAAVFVLPSILRENLPLAIIEAMSKAIPVITTNFGGQAEIIQDGINGLLVKPGDPADLAEKISTILDNPELAREMGRRGRKIVEENHTPEQHLRRLTEVYESAVRNEQSYNHNQLG